MGHNGRRVTRHLIMNHAVCKSVQIVFRSMHKGEYLSGFVMLQLWSPCVYNINK